MFNVVHSGTNSRYAIYAIPAASAEDQHYLGKRFLQPGFLLLGRFRCTPFQAVVSRSICKHQLPSQDNYLPYVTILLNKPNETATTFNTMLCLFSREGLRHKLWTNFFPRKSLSKICLAAFLRTPRRSRSNLVVIRLSCITMARLSSIFSLDWEETGRPRRGSILQRFSAFFKTREPSEGLCTTLSSPHKHFQGLVHHRGRFPRFEVKCNYARCSKSKLLTHQTNTRSLRRWWNNYWHYRDESAVRTIHYSAKLIAGRSEKTSLIIHRHTVYYFNVFILCICFALRKIM